MTDHFYAIYVITNVINAKQYVGVTKRLDERWKEHRSFKGSKLLSSSFKKYGFDSFVFSHIASSHDLENAHYIEKLLIAEKNTKSPNGYNLPDGGEGSLGLKGKIISQKQREQMRLAFTGKKHLPSFGEKISLATKGKKKPEGFGEKISRAHKGKTISEEHRKKISLAQSGRKQSEESNRKRSEKLKGRPSPRKGVTLSPESIEKQRASILATWAIKKAANFNVEKEAQ